MNARQIGGTLTPPGVYGFQLGVERRDPNRLVAILGALFQSCQEFARRIAAVRGLGEEEIVFQLRFFLRDHLRDETAKGEAQQVDLSKTERSEERRVGKECRSRWSPY